MTVLVPWVLWVTAGAMLALVGAHLLSVGTPPTMLLPTARFVSPGDATAVSRARRPQDVWWLLLRLLVLLLAGLALSGVQCAPQRVAVARVLVIDADVRDTTNEWRRVIDSALASPAPLTGVVWRNGSAVVRAEPFDDALRDSARRLAVRDAPRDHELTLAGALLRARRLAPVAAAGADSLALHVLTRLEQDATSAALPAVRAGWPGYVQVRVVPAATSAAALKDSARGALPRPDIQVVRGSADDVVDAAYGVARHADVGSLAWRAVRIVRDSVAAALTADDSSHARGGGVLVSWTRASAVTRAPSRDSTVPNEGAMRLRTGVVARGVALVSEVRETWPRRAGDSREDAPAARAVAWYLDGAPAVIETALGEGCVRTVGFAAPDGDLLLTPSARGVLHAIAAPCGAAIQPDAGARLSQAILEPEIVSGTRTALAARSSFGYASTLASPQWLTRALLLGALLLLLIEHWWRRT
jgi:hypothetical protein